MNEERKSRLQRAPLPEWLKRPLPKGEKYHKVLKILGELKLNTVCSGASCPNQGECYSHGTATFMIMGDICTRNCRFCGVSHGRPSSLQTDEPTRLADAVRKLQLKYVVITSVTRDDLPGGGAEHFAATIRAVRDAVPSVTIEVLTPDFQGDTICLDVVCRAAPNVFNHNIETTRRLAPEIRSGADYDRSLTVLSYVAGRANGPIVKSGFMLGLGESRDEISQALTDLRDAKVNMLTIGQYLQPSRDNRPVQKFYPPDEFDEIKKQAQQMGFTNVAAGPFVRSSYHAELNLAKTDANI